MTRIGIIGGQLQGLEAVYLALQAKFEVALIDKDPLVPARSLVDEFYQLNLLDGGRLNEALLSEFDLILPATENYATLEWLNRMGRKHNVPVALDLPAYTISSSKIKSNELFAQNGIARPEPWPDCGFPVIVKPSGLSGSAGVMKVTDQAQLEDALRGQGIDLVIEAYLAGPSYSLEVIADRGKCAGLQVTELNFDAGFDCKRVLAGPLTGAGVASAFFDLGERIAAVINLSGIMDIEVIDTGKELKVLEIDARLPSQTPSAVYHSTKTNMVELLADYWINGKLPPRPSQHDPGGRAVIYEHLKLKNGILEVSGEHILVGAQSLKVYRDKFSTDVFISNFEECPDDWVATAIYTENTEAQVWGTRNRAVKIMQQAFKAKSYYDPDPLPV
ncbi:MAG: 3-methylornithine--L-lysine ligase PylC [Eubacteriales bacterium]